jgi:CotH kinase protein/Lamin Tail Domain/Chitobiase/beta-hexosaminidase C-terminal domain
VNRLLAVVASILLASELSAGPIAFSSAIATYDQGAPYTIASAIDGTLSGSNGWGVHGQRFTAQTAVFRTSATVNATALRMVMFQNLGSGHIVNEFRLSVTTDAVPAVAGSWTVLAPTSFISSTSTLTAVGDRIRTGAAAGGTAAYTITAPAPFAGITGIRLEVYPFDWGGGFGATIGRATANGNFVLSEFQAESDPAVNIALNKPVISSGSLWGTFPVTNIVDGNAGSFTHPLDGANTLGFFYEVNLGDDFALTEIRLRNRADGCCPERLTHYEVQLYDADTDGEGPGALLWNGVIRPPVLNPPNPPTYTNSGVAGIDTVTAASGSGVFRARYMRVVNLSNAAYNPQLAEIEAYGSKLPSIQSFTISGDDTISAGQSTTLAWATVNATTVSISPAVGVVSGGGTTTVSPAATTTYTLTATNASGAVNRSVTVGVDVTLAPPEISELAATQSSLSDEDGDSPDWVEIRNPNNYRLDLAGLKLADASATWTFPAVTMQPNAFLVVFASGKNRTNPAANLHTNFTLSASGETLTLRDPADAILQTVTFGAQKNNVSFGTPAGGGAAGFFVPPTPGAVNGTTAFTGLVGDTAFSVDRGFFSAPIAVAITCPATPDAQIRYTTNGDAPTATTGTVYGAPVNISTTTVLRAAAFKPGFAPSNVDTQTYIFPAAVLAQPVNPAGFPATWTDAGTNYASDYQMDPDVVNAPAYAPEMDAGLKSIRTLSIVMPHADLWGASGIYMNPQQRGLAWEKASSIELILPPDAANPGGSTGFQHNAGVRIYGYGWRSHSASKKHAMRLKFKDIYDGPGKLDYPLFPGWPVEKHDDIILRSQGSRSWNDFRTPDISQACYIRDSFARDSAIAMGKADGPATYVHLYLNGLYWGLYNAVLRPDAGFGEEHYGGTDADYDALNARVGAIEVIDGNRAAWDQVLALVAAGLSNSANYAALQQLVDVDNLIDHVIYNLWATNHDGPGNQNNFRALRKRAADGRWRFYFWDMEYTLWSETENAFTGVAASGETVWPVFTALKTNVEFRVRFGDRLHRHCFNGGALTPAKAVARWNARATEIYTAILCESARWGDVRREPPFTRNAEWTTERTRLTGTYFPNRNASFIPHAQAQSLYPSIVAPTLNQHGGYVNAGFNATLTAPAGTIYFTTDGADPRAAGGGVAGTAYSGPISLNTPGYATVRARALNGGVWSAMTDARFSVALTAPAPVNIIFSEIHYNPLPGVPAFIELMNIGAGAVDLSGCRFTQGITYTFPSGTFLPAGARIVVNDTQFSGQLSNSGEAITLTQPDGLTVIRTMIYSGSPPWDTAANGTGPSLVLIAPFSNPDLGNPRNWRSSSGVGGNPGTSDSTTFTGDPNGDGDGDGMTAFLEYALGTSDSNPDSDATFIVTIVGDNLHITHRRAAAADDVIYELQWTTSLAQPWQPAPATLILRGPDADTFRVTPPVSTSPAQSLRLKVTLRP